MQSVCARRCLRFKLSLRDLVEPVAERGLSLVHTAIMRWVQRCAPAFVERWNRFSRPVGRSWRVDETYLTTRYGTGRPPEASHSAGSSAISALIETNDATVAASSAAAQKRSWP